MSDIDTYFYIFLGAITTAILELHWWQVMLWIPLWCFFGLIGFLFKKYIIKS